jgi:putative endonuclease
MIKSCCYILKCKDDSYYVGSTSNIDHRIKYHILGKVKYTKSRLPLKLIFIKEFESFNQAFLFEQKVKSWKKRKSIENMLNKPDNQYLKYINLSNR